MLSCPPTFFYDFIYIVSDFNYLLNKHLWRLVFIISPIIFFGDDEDVHDFGDAARFDRSEAVTIEPVQLVWVSIHGVGIDLCSHVLHY